MSNFSIDDKEVLITAVTDKIREREVISFSLERGIREVETEDSYREWEPDGTEKLIINFGGPEE